MREKEEGRVGGGETSLLATIKKIEKNGNKHRNEKNKTTIGSLWNGTLPLKVAPFSWNLLSCSMFEPGSASWSQRKQTSLLYSIWVFSISGERVPVSLMTCFQIIAQSSFISHKFYNNIKFLLNTKLYLYYSVQIIFYTLLCFHLHLVKICWLIHYRNFKQDRNLNKESFKYLDPVLKDIYWKD